jgi:Domain of unknown function (DUF5668)/B-box zinc finger
MNCANHPELQATAFCRTCGKPLCDQCRRDAYGTVFCDEHAPAPAAAVPPNPAGMGAPPPPYVPPPYSAPGPPQQARVYADVSPGLALFLGFIPGVGAIYNGQYAKGILHAVIWGVLMSIADHVHGAEPLMVITVMAFWAYMALEAYHTARKRRAGEPVDEYSSIINLRTGRDLPLVAIGLILFGGVLLLYTLDLIDFERVARFWPVLLIAAGVYLLYGRFRGEVGNERN